MVRRADRAVERRLEVDRFGVRRHLLRVQRARGDGLHRDVLGGAAVGRGVRPRQQPARGATRRVQGPRRRPRPPASAARGIGSWANILHFLSILGIFINLLFLTFTIRPQWSSSLSLNERILLAVAAEHVLIAAKIALDKLIPDVPAAMRKRTARLQYMATRAAQRGSVSAQSAAATSAALLAGMAAAPLK